jgi:hypothetical protein
MFGWCAFLMRILQRSAVTHDKRLVKRPSRRKAQRNVIHARLSAETVLPPLANARALFPQLAKRFPLPSRAGFLGFRCADQNATRL